MCRSLSLSLSVSYIYIYIWTMYSCWSLSLSLSLSLLSVSTLWPGGRRASVHAGNRHAHRRQVRQVLHIYIYYIYIHTIHTYICYVAGGHSSRPSWASYIYIYIYRPISWNIADQIRKGTYAIEEDIARVRYIYPTPRTAQHIHTCTYKYTNIQSYRHI